MSTKSKMVTVIFTTLFLITSQAAYTQNMDSNESNNINSEIAEEDTSTDQNFPSSEELEEMKKIEAVDDTEESEESEESEDI